MRKLPNELKGTTLPPPSPIKKLLSKQININTAIELPSDEEIEKEAFQIPFNNTNEFYDKSFIKGAKWMKEQIINQNK